MSLRTRLLLSYAVIIIVSLCAVSASMLLLLRPVAERALIAGLQAAAEAQLTAIDDTGVGTMSLERASRLAATAARRMSGRVLLLDAGYEVLFDSESAVPKRNLEGVNMRTRWALERLSGTPDEGGTFPDPVRPGQQWYFVLAGWPVPQGSPVRYVVYARLDSRLPLPAIIRDRFLPEIAVGSALALALAVVLAYLIARSIVRPLQSMARGAHALARGEYGHTVPVAGPGEVREVATAFNRMSTEVLRTQQAQRDFVANVSHELKTPLTSIQGFSQAIVDGAAGDDAGVRQAAGVIHAEAERLRRLADDLLELARLDAGQITMRREPVDLAAVLRACGDRLSLRAQEAGVTLTVQAPANLPLTGDGDRLAQVFTNLLDNALTHTPAGGRITMAAGEEQGTIAVRVADTGKGIPAAELPRIFERFYQVDKSRRRSTGGAGLGLAIVRELVQAHGGTVSVKSIEGMGTEFTVELPKTGAVKAQSGKTTARG